MIDLIVIDQIYFGFNWTIGDYSIVAVELILFLWGTGMPEWIVWDFGSADINWSGKFGFCDDSRGKIETL